jgi:energy-coupling factor transporter ATP-binding protein EcfA2
MAPKEQKLDIRPQQGERALIVGQTGSGKSAFLIWLLMRVPMSPVIIYETKEEPKFQHLPGVVFVQTPEDLYNAYHDQAADYIVMQPDIDTCSNPTMLDELLYTHYNQFPNSVCAIDELYMFHNSGRHGRGLLGLYTRGRSRGITTISCTQRPAWISGFAISEAQKYYAFYLEMMNDKKKIKPQLVDLPDPPKYGFYYWESGNREVTKYGGVKLDKGLDTGYTDKSGADAIAFAPDQEGADTAAPASKKRGATFI